MGLLQIVCSPSVILNGRFSSPLISLLRGAMDMTDLRVASVEEPCPHPITESPNRIWSAGYQMKDLPTQQGSNAIYSLVDEPAGLVPFGQFGKNPGQLSVENHVIHCGVIPDSSLP